MVTPDRLVHILDGDPPPAVNSGGHGPGRGISGKSEFPAILTDDEIINGVEAIANDPASYPGNLIPATGGRMKIVGHVKGVRTVVIVNVSTRQVVTAWPYDVPRNP